jgi:anti-sigma-K factor RskA
MNYLQPERLDRLAREYALGTLHGRARRRFERLLRESSAAARAVGRWQGRLGILAASVPAMQPREAVWQALRARITPGAAERAAPRNFWHRLAGWFSARNVGGTLAGALAGLLVATVVLRLQPGLVDLEQRQEKLPESYVGLLLDASGKPSLLASSRRHGLLLTVKMLQPLSVPAGQVAQLWALPRDGSAAIPVGTVPDRGSATVALAASSETLFFSVAELAVSLEPAAAKPGDRPSGPFVLRGHCVKLW